MIPSAKKLLYLFCKMYSLGVGSCNRLKKNIILFSNVIAYGVFSKSILIYRNRRSFFFQKYSPLKYSPKYFFEKVFKIKYSNSRNLEEVFAWFYSLFLKSIQKIGIRTAVFQNVFAKKYSHANTFWRFE